jgi:hypothetical protein
MLSPALFIYGISVFARVFNSFILVMAFANLVTLFTPEK